MNLVRIIEWLRRRLTTVVRVCLVGLALLVLVDAIPGVVDKEHAHTALERWPGFWALFGFLGCVVLILVSKWFGHCGIMKDEDYYDE
jgi:succinate dehydrogenase hydrophobic anchor subunit